MARDKEKRSCGQVLAEWRAFVWDPRSRQVLGRTGTSWGRSGGVGKGGFGEGGGEGDFGGEKGIWGWGDFWRGELSEGDPPPNLRAPLCVGGAMEFYPTPPNQRTNGC